MSAIGICPSPCPDVRRPRCGRRRRRSTPSYTTPRDTIGRPGQALLGCGFVPACSDVPYAVHSRVNERKRLPARFFESDRGKAPVREWLLSLNQTDRKAIGDDIRTAEFGWPVGMPLCRALKGRKGLWEIRSNLEDGRIAMVFFSFALTTEAWCSCTASSRIARRPRTKS